MADMTYGAGHPTGGSPAQSFGMATQIAGAAVSLALIAGMGVWGYQLMVRDASGIPVVRAMDGPMREVPANPGGDLAVHTGLAVNAVAAVGEAAPPEDRLALAPTAAELAEEDLLVQPTAEASEVLPAGVALAAPQDADDPLAALTEATATPVDPEPMTAEDILALADQISAGSAPLTELAEEPIVLENAVAEAVGEAMAALEDEEGAPALPPGLVPAAELTGGLAEALRPPARPAELTVASANVAPAAEAAPASDAFTVDNAALPAGTVLVQLGAFDSAAIAGGEWGTLNGRFAEFMAGKERLIQTATSGGREFFRLRATGFADLDEARRFCSALIAEGAACIPFVEQ